MNYSIYKNVLDINCPSLVIFQLHGMTPRPLWTSSDKDGHVWSVACQTMELGLPTVRVEGNPRVLEYWLEEHVDYELYTDPSNILMSTLATLSR